MNRKILAPVISVLIVFLIAQFPIFPLLVETREILDDGEKLYQMWRFVSMPEFYDAADYARLGWLDTTWSNYLILFLLNHIGLILVFFMARKTLRRFLEKNR